ncbi:MAG TPA: hypothetical protein VKD72_01430 [Gemmataceae bacterium]|nr:hypothetical protein [Gemmataceae bacterium]
MATKTARGIVEIETLRRYGRVPPGTRAQGSFTLARIRGPLGNCLKFQIRIGDDPRKVARTIYFDWSSQGKVRMGWWHRGAHKSAEVDLKEWALIQVSDEIEEMNTSKGHQRFCVIRVEWVDE